MMYFNDIIYRKKPTPTMRTVHIYTYVRNAYTSKLKKKFTILFLFDSFARDRINWFVLSLRIENIKNIYHLLLENTVEHWSSRPKTVHFDVLVVHRQYYPGIIPPG